eukprot:7603167-Lingulodinium_polyedra.AAC.1
MGRALGLDPGTAAARTVRADARQWAAMPRDRMLLSTLPHVPCSYKLGREWPWTPTWAPHGGGGHGTDDEDTRPGPPPAAWPA